MIWSIELCTVCPDVYILCVLFLLFLRLRFPSYVFFFLTFAGISSANRHETSLVHLGEPSGLKVLLHTLNATVIPMKVG